MILFGYILRCAEPDTRANPARRRKRIQPSKSAQGMAGSDE